MREGQFKQFLILASASMTEINDRIREIPHELMLAFASFNRIDYRPRVNI